LSRVDASPPQSEATRRPRSEPELRGGARRERSFFGRRRGAIDLARAPGSSTRSSCARSITSASAAPSRAPSPSRCTRSATRSLFFMTVVMGFIGMILVYQAGLQTKRVLPDLTMLGATFLELLVRDLAASIGALMLATRVGAGIAAEIGSMVVTEQVDALRMSAADPIDYLIKPRFIASVVMTTVLIIWSGRPSPSLSGHAHRRTSIFDVPPARSSTSAWSTWAISRSASRSAWPTARRSPSSRALRPLDLRRLRGRRLGHDPRRRQLLPRRHHAQLLHLARCTGC
jgi:hypothetical protein